MDIRRNKLFMLPRKLMKYILSVLYHPVIYFYKLPKVESIDNTLDLIIKEKKSVSRLGDGEISIIVDKVSYPFQRYDESLARRMSEILVSNNQNILVCLPIGFHSLKNLNKGTKVSWKAHIALVYPRFKKYLDLNKTYYNASITRPYIGYQDKSSSKRYFEKIKKIWDKRDVLLIEGEKSRLGVNNDLFANANKLERILAPAENAFGRIEEITAYVQKFDKKTLVLVALGPTATVMAYDLANLGYQALDIGNVDIEYEWFLRGVNEKVKIPGKYTSEVKKGREVEDVNDETYNKQVIAKFL